MRQALGAKAMRRATDAVHAKHKLQFSVLHPWAVEYSSSSVKLAVRAGAHHTRFAPTVLIGLDDTMTPDQPPASGSALYVDAALLLVPQALVSLLAAAWIDAKGGQTAGCGADCDYALLSAVNHAIWFSFVVITVLAFVGLVAWQKWGLKRWPIVLGGLGLTILATYVADKIVSFAIAM
jgi:hypothetical protein